MKKYEISKYETIPSPFRRLRGVFVLCSLFLALNASTQTTFPASDWDNAINLSSLLSNKSYELSGLYWNDFKKQLFIVCDDGRFVLLSLNTATNTFSLTADITGLGGPEGVMQIDDSSNEFFTVDENSYEIRKYTLSANYSTVTQMRSWNLLASPSPMPDTGNDGPEGITFVPDEYLHHVAFTSSETGKPYLSQKGMNGLTFIAHQDEGYVWVFDVNPDVKDDFLYVGKYKTNRKESCDLSFDRTTGLMYILHNTGKNFLEVTDMTTTVKKGEYIFNTLNEYYIPNPLTGSDNIEGFALTPKFSASGKTGAWLCRDVKASEKDDCLRWFTPFDAPGKQIVFSGLPTKPKENHPFTISLHDSRLKIECLSTAYNGADIVIQNINGQILFAEKNITFPFTHTLTCKIPNILTIIKENDILLTKKISTQ